MRSFIVILALLSPFLSCSSQQRNPVSEKQEHQYRWVKLTDSAAFAKSYNYQMFARNGYLYAMHSKGAWRSSNGKEWELTGLSNKVGNQAFLDYVEYKGALYALGTFEGNIERFRLGSGIARTDDMKTWRTVAATSELPPRFFYHPFVFKGKIWIIGGTDGKNSYDDAWTSEDAVHWKKVAEGLPFGKRESQQFLVFRDRLYMLSHDVWVSDDGLSWKQVIPKIAEHTFGYAALIYDEQIWLIGCNRSGKFQSEVLYSTDGRTWKTQRTEWSPRGGVAAVVFNNRIYMTGGKYGGQDPNDVANTEFVYSNDVWYMERKQGSYAAQR